MKAITRFRGQYRFLSNFYPSPVVWEGSKYPTVEHAYQAAKTVDPEERVAIAKLDTPGQAKRAGRNVHLRPHWYGMKVAVMGKLVQYKFVMCPDLADKLLATGDAELVEGNDWGDTFWGICRGIGQNMLGRILMRIRAEIKRSTD